MADEEKLYDNSWVAVWKREVNELNEKINNKEHYSAAEVSRMQRRKQELEKLIANKTKKKDLTGGFARGRENVENQASVNMARMAQMTGNRAA